MDDSVSSVSPRFGNRSSVQVIIAQMFKSIFKLRDINCPLVQELAALARNIQDSRSAIQKGKDAILAFTSNPLSPGSIGIVAILFSFATLSRIENISIISCTQTTQQYVERAASDRVYCNSHGTVIYAFSYSEICAWLP